MTEADPWSRLAQVESAKKERLLVEVKEILRLAPTPGMVGRGTDDLIAWGGRAAAAISRWDVVYAVTTTSVVDDLLSDNSYTSQTGLSKLKALLRQAEADLTLDVGPASVVIPEKAVFEYFDELRKVIETARDDVFFVDAYLDADFVPRYLPFVAIGAGIRLLGGPKKMPTLLPAVEMFAQQNKRPVEVRSSPAIHERYLFVDRRQCYASGASFKDGAKNAPALLMQITDAFASLQKSPPPVQIRAAPRVLPVPVAMTRRARRWLAAKASATRRIASCWYGRSTIALLMAVASRRSRFCRRKCNRSRSAGVKNPATRRGLARPISQNQMSWPLAMNPNGAKGCLLAISVT